MPHLAKHKLRSQRSPTRRPSMGIVTKAETSFSSFVWCSQPSHSATALKNPRSHMQHRAFEGQRFHGSHHSWNAMTLQYSIASIILSKPFFPHMGNPTERVQLNVLS